VFLLIAANIAIYAWLARGVGVGAMPSEILIRHGAMGSFALPLREYWRLVAYGFLHADLMHLATNMLCLLLWGPYLEKRVGSLYFAIIYLGALVGAALVTNFAHSTPYITVGASGAVAGILGALLCLSILGKMDLSAQFFATNIGFNVVLAFAVPNVDWRAHVGGFIAGLVCCAALNVLGGPLRVVLRCKFPEFVKLNGTIAVVGLMCVLWAMGSLPPFGQPDAAGPLAIFVILALVAIKAADWLLCMTKGLAVLAFLFAGANAVIAFAAIGYFSADIAIACRARPATNVGFFNGTLTLLCADLHITAQFVAGLIFALTLLLYGRELRKGLSDVGFVANGLQAERKRIEGI
jgi:rhomboid protease GluP